VLSERLCDSRTFCACEVRQLIPQRRHKRIEAKLLVEMRAHAIVCLQEVSIRFADQLAAFFEKHNYHFIHDHYANRASGWMGVAIAFPRDQYALETQRVEMPTDQRWIREHGSKARRSDPNMHDGGLGGFALLGGIALLLLKLGAMAVAQPSQPSLAAIDTAMLLLLSWTLAPRVAAWRGRRKPPGAPGADGVSSDETFYELLMASTNRLLLLKLKHLESGSFLWMGNFHMPCKYQFPGVMVAFAALAVQSMQRLSGGVPCMLAGDWNSLPDSAVYGMITSGTCAPGSAGYPSAATRKTGDAWQPEVVPMRSAYAAAHGKEPELTNHARTKYHDQPAATFTGTLDYIFVSAHWETPTKCIGTPTVRSLKGVASFPDGNEPSDHVMIGCSLRTERMHFD